MLRARAALAVGVLVVLAAFAWGTENDTSATIAGQEVDCGYAISASWLLSGTSIPTSGGEVATTVDERRVAAGCDAAVQRARAGVLSTMAAGALLALVGWTAHREPRERRTLAVGRSAPG